MADRDADGGSDGDDATDGGSDVPDVCVPPLAGGVRALVREFPGTDVEAAVVYRDYEEMLLLEAKLDTLSVAMARTSHAPTLARLGARVCELSEQLVAARPVRRGVLDGARPIGQAAAGDVH